MEKKQKINFEGKLHIVAAAVLILSSVMIWMGYGQDIEYHAERIVAIAQEMKIHPGIYRIYTTNSGGYGYASPLFYGDVSGSFSGGIGRGYCNCIPPVSGVYYAGIVFVHVFLRQFSVGQENGCVGGISLCIFTDSSGGHFYPVCGRRGTGICIFTDRSAWFLSDRDRAEEAIDRLDSLIDWYVRTDIFPYYIHSPYRDPFNASLYCLYKKNLEE